MKKTFRFRFWLYVAVALLACVYVLVYNQEQLIRNQPTGRHLVAAAVILLKIQWFAFIVPLIASVVGIFAIRKHRWSLLILPDTLAAFSVGWILLTILIWQLQEPPVVAYPGF